MIERFNQAEADRICTAVVLGYCKDNQHTMFQYHKAGDESSYENIKSLFHKCGVTIDVSLSINKSRFPLIVAKCKTAPTTEQAQAIADSTFTNRIETSVNSSVLTENLYPGAYLGGYSTISTTHLVGVSDLELYDARFRIPLAPEENYSKSYSNAVSVSKTINSAINDFNHSGTGVQTINGIKISLPNSDTRTALNTTFASYSEGKLFKSYHGMILAMTKFATDIDVEKNGYFFEVALGKDTNKVSSCFPCTTFMKAQGKPPTSIHLGRGDNWNIPSDVLISQRTSWNEKIQQWFSLGKSTLESKSITMQAYNADDIPAIFLEALTFESSFINKIQNTLGHIS